MITMHACLRDRQTNIMAIVQWFILTNASCTKDYWKHFIEMWMWWTMLKTSWTEKVTNKEVLVCTNEARSRAYWKRFGIGYGRRIWGRIWPSFDASASLCKWAGIHCFATVDYWLMTIDSLIWRCTVKYWWSPWCYCLLLCISLLVTWLRYVM